MKRMAIIMSLLLGISLVAFAAYEPDIKWERHQDIQEAMLSHVNEHLVDNTYFIYDAVTNDMKRLQFKTLHSGIERSEGFLVSCAKFTDGMGRAYCVDLVVVEEEGTFNVIESILHVVDNQARDYALISALWSPGYYYGIED